jgi:putative ABC transport system permease protein
MARPFRVVGLSRGTSGFMTGIVFITHSAGDTLLGARGTTGYVLVGTGRPQAAERQRARGLTVLTRRELAANSLELTTGIYGPPIRLMVAVAFAVGALVIALTAYTSVVERRREYGIVRAIGARGSTLTVLAVRQTLALAVLGLLAGALLYAAGRAVITAWRPQFSVVLTPAGLGRAVAAALLMGLVAAVVPVRRLVATDPASAYRGG